MAEARGEQQRHPEKKTHDKYVSNDSSLAGDEFYDAMDYVGKARRMSSTGGASSAFGSNTSRARSSSAGTLLPSPAAAELMAVLASVGSSKNLDVSAFSTAGEFETPGSLAIDEGEPGGTLGLDGFYGYRSKNPFNNDDNNSVAEEGGSNATDVRRWPPPQHQQPSKVVVMDISSAENTPVHTPVDIGSRRLSGEGGGGGGGGRGGGGAGQAPLWGARSPSSSPRRRPPPLPPRRESNPFAEEAAFAAAAAAAATTPKTATTAAASTNPFATPTPSLNPFVTASSSLNPFADDDCEPAAKEGQGEEEEQEWATASPAGGRLVAAAGAAAVAGGGNGGGSGKSAAAPPSREGKPKPPPLPPRRAGSPTGRARATSTTSTTATTPTLMTATTSTATTTNTTTTATVTNPPASGRGGGAGEGATSGPASPRSALSSATCDSVGAADLDGSEGMDAGGSVGSSTASDATGGTADKKYMVVNKDTGQKFDLRELEQHLPVDDYAFLPSRKDLIELERRRSVHGSGGSGADGKFPPPRSGSASPRSSLPTPGKPSTRKEKAKQLGSMMRKKFGKAANAAGAAATAASAASAAIASSSPRTSTGNATATATCAAVAEGDGDASKPVTPGAAGDRGSGGMGAAARVVSDALAGIRVSLKGKESSETLAGLMLFQELRCHDGPIWAAAFNHSGKFLATAGQDARILLHRVGDVREDIGDGASGSGPEEAAAAGSVPSPASSSFSDTPAAATATAAAAGNRRSKGGETGQTFPPEGSPAAHATEGGGGGGGGGGDANEGGPRGSEEAAGGSGGAGGGGAKGSTASDDEAGGGRPSSEKRAAATVLIDTTPWQILEAHRGDVVALSWSRNDFLLSASLDKTVRLWHTTQGHCLHFFQHAETVTSVDFHPCFEHFFLSGCFDKKVRVWNIRDGRVHEWQQAPDMVTAAKFSLDGQMIVAGLYMGQVLFYQTEGMRYFTQIECRNRRGTKKRGCKVSGFAFKKTDVVKKEDNGTGSGKEGEGAKDGTSKEGKINDANSSATKDNNSSGGSNVKGGSRSGKDRGGGNSGGGSGGGGSGGGDGVDGSGIDIRPPAASSPGVGRPLREGAPPSLGGSGGSVGGSGTGGGVGGRVGGGGGGGGGAGSHIPEQLLVTTNDSRLRLYNTDDFGMNAKYKGFTNDTLQITASFSEDGKQIICGSENGKVYVWSTGVFAATSPSTLPGSPALPPLSTALPGGPAAAAAPSQKDTNRCHESFQATFDPPRIVTTACFVPESTSRACVTAVRGGLSKGVMESEGGGYCGCMILATDYSGHLRVYCKSAIFLS